MRMTITNRDYNVSLEDKESQPFKLFANEVENNVNNALKDLEGFVYSRVEKFAEANSVSCQVTVFVLKTSKITEETIKEELGNSLGDLTITSVTVVDSERTTNEPATTTPSEEGVVFEVTVRIPNEEYSEELGDSSSEEFKTLSTQLTDILTEVFEDKIPGFRRVEIIEFRKGSIICIFNVITEKETTASDEKIKDVLTKASNSGEIGNYTFEEIEVERKTAKVTNDKDKKWPEWVIAVISVSGVMLLLILLMIYLIYKRYKYKKVDLSQVLDAYDNVVELEEFHKRKMTMAQVQNEPNERH